MKLNRKTQGLLYLIGAYVQLILCLLTLYLPSFLANVSIALLASIYITAIFTSLRKRSKNILYIFAGVQFFIWAIAGFYLGSLLGLLLFLSMFLVFGLSAKGLAVLFSDKKESKNKISKQT